MPLVLDEAKTLLRTVIRSIDRKADFSVTLQEGDRPGVAVNMTLRGHSTNCMVPQEVIESAGKDAVRRSQLRNSLKRAIDRMMFVVSPITSTKMLRGAVVDGGFFRVQQRGRTGRR